LLAEAEKETLPNVLVKTPACEKEITSKIFRTAYKVAKENQSFHKFEAELDLQELNAIDMGRILHSANAYTNTVNHISTEMRKALVNEIIRSKTNISIIIDESTTLSEKSILIIYVQVCLANYGMNYPVNLFFGFNRTAKCHGKWNFSSLTQLFTIIRHEKTLYAPTW
jgi:hypothetical protein